MQVSQDWGYMIKLLHFSNQPGCFSSSVDKLPIGLICFDSNFGSEHKINIFTFTPPPPPAFLVCNPPSCSWFDHLLCGLKINIATFESFGGGENELFSLFTGDSSRTYGSYLKQSNCQLICYFNNLIPFDLFPVIDCATVCVCAAWRVF